MVAIAPRSSVSQKHALTAEPPRPYRVLKGGSLTEAQRKVLESAAPTQGKVDLTGFTAVSSYSYSGATWSDYVTLTAHVNEQGQAYLHEGGWGMPRWLGPVQLPTELPPVKPGYTRIADGQPATLSVPKSNTPQSAMVLTVRFPEGAEEYVGSVRVEVEGESAGSLATYPPALPGSERSFFVGLTDATDPKRAAEIQKKLKAGTLKVTVRTGMPGVDVKVRPFR